VTLHLIHHHHRCKSLISFSCSLFSSATHISDETTSRKGHRTASLTMASPQETDETPFFLSALKTHGPKPYNSDLSGC
jgi:hypothetical protein